MFNGELYAQVFQKLIYLHLVTDCVVKTYLQIIGTKTVFYSQQSTCFTICSYFITYLFIYVFISFVLGGCVANERAFKLFDNPPENIVEYKCTQVACSLSCDEY